LKDDVKWQGRAKQMIYDQNDLRSLADEKLGAGPYR
jgi:hypothetical protein